jgi:D-cysteine desulfhydrase
MKDPTVVFPPRLPLAQLPTPITLLERTTAAWGGPRIWVKRDDDTGGVLSGNKVRKLAYVVHQALEQGADTLLTCGGLQSNHCRATAAIARRLGLEVVLCLRGVEPPLAQGNYLLDRLLGAEVRFITPEQYRARDEVMQAVARELRARGRRPYVIAEGASMPLGAWGYIEACEEIARAQEDLGVVFDTLVHAVGSGGTSAGLELGVRLLGLRAKVWGVNVCDDQAYFRSLIHRIAVEAIDRFRLPVQLRPEEIGFLDGYVGRGYGKSRPEEWTVILEAGRREGLILDPVYTGKAFYALAKEVAGGRLAESREVLFLHTGGVYELFPLAAEIPWP